MNEMGPDIRTESKTPISPLSAFFAALQFLTITPPLVRRPFTLPELARGVGFYPLVGLLIGLTLYLADGLFGLVFPNQINSALILALWVLLSGALHLDGFLDACDGLFGGSTVESRLRILHDERVGAFALAGGILLLLVKFTAIANSPLKDAALIIAPTLGRWGIAVALFAFPYAREEGLGRALKDHVTWRQLVLASFTALIAAWLIVDWRGIMVAGVAALVVWLGAVFTLHRIPGLTGDVYGAINELVEVAVLLTLIAIC